MEGLAYSIMKVLAYFDVFSYPLSREEIHLFLDQKAQPEELFPVLKQLTKEGFIYELEGFYTLHNDVSLIARRISENQRAQALLPKARMVSRLLLYFPFVRAIGISGSLSKNVASPEADFDYFIITQTNRLWVARTFLYLLKWSSYLVGKQNWFCLNYYIDESNLLIPEQNIYTATEIMTLIISRPNTTSDLFLSNNAWINQYYPNFLPEKLVSSDSSPTFNIKKLVEDLLDLAFLNQVDNFLLNLMVKRLRKKRESGKIIIKNGKLRQISIIDKHYCKQDPAYFQDKVIKAYTAKLKHILEKYQGSNQSIKTAFPGL